MKNTRRIVWSFVFLIGILAATSCRGVKIQHGRDCGCGSFSQVEQEQTPNQQ